MSLPQCIEGCPQHETRVRNKPRHRSRTVSKTSLRGEAQTKKNVKNTKKLEKARMAGGSRASRGVWGGSRGFQGGSRGGPGGGPEVLAEKRLKTKTKKCSGTVWLANYAATSRILCRRFQ